MDKAGSTATRRIGSAESFSEGLVQWRGVIKVGPLGTGGGGLDGRPLHGRDRGAGLGPRFSRPWVVFAVLTGRQLLHLGSTERASDAGR